MSRLLRDTIDQPRARLLLLHGAGAPMDSEWMTTATQVFNTAGLEVVRWEFNYMHQRRIDGKKRPPTKAPQLLLELGETIQSLATWDSLPLIVAGKSMGGRMATMLAAEQPGLPITQLVALGYPFHPTGKPERLRIEHFPRLHCPLHIVQGSNDTMGNKALVSKLPIPQTIKLTWVEGGNHDLRPKGLKAAEVMSNLSATLAPVARQLIAN